MTLHHKQASTPKKILALTSNRFLKYHPNKWAKNYHPTKNLVKMWQSFRPQKNLYLKKIGIFFPLKKQGI